jgi:hypothetical protein
LRATCSAASAAPWACSRAWPGWPTRARMVMAFDRARARDCRAAAPPTPPGLRLRRRLPDAAAAAQRQAADVLACVQCGHLWWAALACVLPMHQPWAQANAEAVPRALALFPGLAGRVQALQAAEAVRRALPWPQPGDDPALTAPVWTWLLPVPAAAAAPLAADAAASPADPAADAAEAARLEGRRRTRQRAAQAGRAPMLLAAKGEALKTFADALALDRGADDSDDGSAAIAAQDIDTLSLVRDACASTWTCPPPAATTSPSAPACGCPNGMCASSACSRPACWPRRWKPASRHPGCRRPRCAPRPPRCGAGWTASAPRRAGSRPRPMVTRSTWTAGSARPPTQRPPCAACTAAAPVSSGTWPRCCWPTCRCPPTPMPMTGSG